MPLTRAAVERLDLRFVASLQEDDIPPHTKPPRHPRRRAAGSVERGRCAQGARHRPASRRCRVRTSSLHSSSRRNSITPTMAVIRRTVSYHRRGQGPSPGRCRDVTRALSLAGHSPHQLTLRSRPCQNGARNSNFWILPAPDFGSGFGADIDCAWTLVVGDQRTAMGDMMACGSGASRLHAARRWRGPPHPTVRRERRLRRIRRAPGIA